MALDFQTLPLLLTNGIDTKTDPKAVTVDKLLVLENGVFTRTGILSKRFGYDVLPTTIQGGTSSITTAKGIAVFEDELVLFTGTRAYSYAESTMAWQDRGPAPSISVRQYPILHNSSNQTNPDGAVGSVVRCVAWEDSLGGIRCTTQDVETGAFFGTEMLISSTGQHPRVVVFGTNFVIMYVDTAAGAGANNLMLRSLPLVSPTEANITPELNFISTLVSAANNFDCAVVGAVTGNIVGRLFVGWNDSGTTTARLSYLDESFSLATPVDHTVAGTNAVSVFGDDNSNVYLTVASSTALSMKRWTYTLSAVGSTITLEAISNVQRICGTVLPSATHGAVLYEVQDDNVFDHRRVRRQLVTLSTGAVATAADFKRSVGLASRIFRYGGNGFVTLVHQSAQQPTYFLIDIGGELMSTARTVIARVAPGDAGPLRTASTLPDAWVVSAGVYEIGGGSSGRLASINATITRLQGVTMTRYDFVSTENFLTARLGRNLLLCGGVVRAYDGLEFAESGFHLYPETLSSLQATLGITITTAGDGTHAEVTSIVCPAGSRIAGGQYFTLYSATDATAYYCWFTVDGSGTDPAPAGKTAIAVAALSTDTATQVATKVATALDALADFIATAAVATVTNTNAANGTTTDAANAAAPNGVATGGVTAAGTYQYIAIYERQDNYGQVIRSAPSDALTVTTTGTSVTIVVPTLRITDVTAPVHIAIYRTTNLGTTFYRLTPIASATVNDQTVDSITFLDNAADSAITSAELLYTTGGVLEAGAPYPVNVLATYRNRVFAGVNLGGFSGLSYTVITPLGEAPYFSRVLTIILDPRGGDVTGLGVLDDKLIIFKESAIFAIAGDGPTNTGAQNDLGDPVLIATDVGCSKAASIVSTAQGIMFQSPKGLYLLDRSMSVRYFGDNVEAYNATPMSGVAMVPNTNQVRWTTATGPALVYDYLFDQWATFTSHEAVDCDVWRGEFVFVRSNGEVHVENRAIWTDNGGTAYIKLRLVTSWLQTAGIQGFQRAQRAYVVGDYRGAHKLRVRVAFDFNPVFTQDVTYDATTALAGTTYGSDPTYGASAVYGGTSQPYQFGLHLERQKCMAVRVSVEDVQSSGYNEGVAINAITLLVGVKKGLNKVPAARRA